MYGTKIFKIFRLVLTAIISLLCAASVFSQIETPARPTIAVLEFDTTRARVSRAVGRDLSDLLVNEILASGRFRVLERTNLSPLQREQFMGLNGSVDPATGAQVGKLIGAQFIVLGSVSEFREKKQGGIFNVLTSYNARIKYNLRVLDSTTGEIVFSKPFEKKVSAMGFGDRTTPVTEYESKAMDKALKESMSETVALIVERLGSAKSVKTAQITEAALSSNADCSLRTGANAPRIMVVIPEIHIRRRIPDPAGETEIIKKLVGRGFNVVDQKQIDAIRDREKVLAAVKNPQAAAALGVEFGADIVIIGEAFSELAARQGNMISTRARVEARAVRTDNARILAADGKFGSGMDIAEFVSAKTALRNAGTQWADYFISEFCRAAPVNAFVSNTGVSAVTPGSNIEIMISGISFSQLRQFADRLEKIPGVTNVRKNLTGNVARINVRYDKSGEDLADVISVTKFGTLPVKIIGLSGSKIEISITR